MKRVYRTLTDRLMVVGIVVLLLCTSCEGFFDSSDDDNGSGSGNGSGADNTSRENAADLDLDTDVQATLSSGSEEHWYVFDSDNEDAYDVIRVAVTNAGSGLRVRIRVVDEDGSIVFTHPETVVGDPGANQRRDFSTPGGRYFVRVDSHWSTTGAYTLNVQNREVNDQYAGNDSRERAHDLGTLPVSNLELMLVGASSRVGGIEEDWFKFTTENDGLWDRVLFALSDVGEGLRPRMTLYEDDGSTVVFTHPSQAPDPGSSQSANLGTPGGTYFLRIDNHWSTYGPYTLSIENLDLIDDFEPNDSRGEAHDLGALPLSAPIEAIIAAGESSRDADWFSFTTPNTDNFTVSISDPGERLRVYIRIEDQAGNGYHGGASGKGVEYALETSNPNSPINLNSERFYVRVTGYNSGDWGEYTLTIAQ